MAGFILVFFFGMMSYLLSRILALLTQIFEVLEICFNFEDISSPDYSFCETTDSIGFQVNEEGGKS